MATQAMAAWVDAIVTVLESVTGQRPTVEFRASPPNQSSKGLDWWGQSLSMQKEPSFWIGAPAQSWADLGRLTLAALGVQEATDNDITSTCRDLMAQTNSIVASQLARHFGIQITGGDANPGSQPNPDGTMAFVWSLDAGTTFIEGAAVWSETLLHHCSGFMVDSAAVKTGPAEAIGTSSGVALQFDGRTVDSVPRLDLKVKFILGRTTLPLREVFKLNVASVIELDHSAIEPADVVIRDRVLARGQVVVVNGNYGLKILPHQ
jgi:flagellar motor switch protein FliN/FliY